jgi:hypothetical protein
MKIKKSKNDGPATWISVCLNNPGSCFSLPKPTLFPLSVEFQKPITRHYIFFFQAETNLHFISFFFLFEENSNESQFVIKKVKRTFKFVRRRGPNNLSMLFGDVKRASKMKTKESQHIISRGHKNLNEEDQRISKC